MGAAIAAAAVAGCGGDGVPTHTLGPPMAFSTSSVSLSAVREQAAPAEQPVIVTVKPAVYSITYGSPTGLPDWLAISGYFTSSDTATVEFSLAHTDVPEGTHTVVVTFYAYNIANDLLGQHDVTVNLTVSETVSFRDVYAGTSAVYGHSNHARTVTTRVLANGERWQVSSDKAWVTLPEGIQEDSADLQIGVESLGLGIGTHNANIQIVNPDDPSETDVLQLSLVVSQPLLSAPTSFTLGGADGLDTAPREHAMSLATGTNSYPWTVTAVTYDQPVGPWLSMSKTSGSIGATGDSFIADADRANLAPGSYNARIVIEMHVLDRVFKATLGVLLHIEENRIYVIENGIGLHDLPSRDRLSAAVQVLNTRGAVTVPWQAVSDQPWLTVTPEGVTGGSLDLQADAAALAADAVHTATVTISSPDAAIENQETITIALWKGSADAGDLSISAPFDWSVANPVFPYVHASKDGVLRTYNIYTGSLVSTLALPYPQSTGMAVSSDGRVIHVPDAASPLYSAIALDTGEVLEETYRWSHSGTRLRYVRVEGRSYVVARGRWFLDFDPDIARARDDRTMFEVTNYGSGSFSYNGHRLDHTAIYSQGVVVDNIHVVVGADSGHVSAMAMAPDDVRFLAGVQLANEFRMYDGMARQRLWALPAPGVPNNAVVRTDGLLVAGSRTATEGADILLLDLDGGSLGTLSSPTGALLDDQMTLTSDSGRLLAPTDTDVIGILALPD